MPRLVELLFGTYRRRILSLLLLHPEQSFYVREIGRLTGPVFEELAGFFRKTAGLADVLREALEPFGQAVRAAFVFGSVAQGKERATSDVGVMVVGSAPFARVVEALASASERLQQEVNPVVMAPDAFRAKLKARDRFVARVVREPKIFLVGDARELGELAEDRAA